MSERQKYLNRKYWDGLHQFDPQCYTCEFLETELCLGCRWNGSGELNHYCFLDHTVPVYARSCNTCCHHNTMMCEDCLAYSHWEEED
jgi:hypothetical protein